MFVSVHLHTSLQFGNQLKIAQLKSHSMTIQYQCVHFSTLLGFPQILNHTLVSTTVLICFRCHAVKVKLSSTQISRMHHDCLTVHEQGTNAM